MIRNLIFDFGKVLVDYDFKAVIDTFFDDPQELARFKELVLGKEFSEACDREEIPFKDIIAQTKVAYPQWEREIQMVYDRYMDFVTVEVPGMRNLLTRYKAEGYKLYGLTNWCKVVYKVIEKYDILQMLDDRVISSEEHVIKPEPAIYQRLLDKFNLKPEECVFTDDKAVNVEGARKAGMHGIVFHDAAQYESELKDILHRTI